MRKSNKLFHFQSLNLYPFLNLTATSKGKIPCLIFLLTELVKDSTTSGKEQQQKGNKTGLLWPSTARNKNYPSVLPQVEGLAVLNTIKSSEQSYAYLLSDPLPAQEKSRSLKTIRGLRRARRNLETDWKDSEEGGWGACPSLFAVGRASRRDYVFSVLQHLPSAHTPLPGLRPCWPESLWF